MGQLIKTLIKLSIVLVIASAIAGVIFVLKQPKDSSPISFEEWPSVPRNPAV